MTPNQIIQIFDHVTSNHTENIAYAIYTSSDHLFTAHSKLTVDVPLLVVVEDEDTTIINSIYTINPPQTIKNMIASRIHLKLVVKPNITHNLDEFYQNSADIEVPIHKSKL